MTLYRIPVLLILFPFIFQACFQEEKPENGEECNIDIDTVDFSFGIDYMDPDRYLVPGEESNLSDAYLEEVRDAIGTPGDSIEDILSVCHWINRHFTFEDAGGAMAGVNTVDELFEKKTFYGCHSQALLISSILRKFGFPAVMIETASVQWGYDYHEGRVQYFAGHVMSEIFVDGKWILLDNNCSYVEEYDPENPYIPVTGHPTYAYFVFAKGTDIWDYNARDPEFTTDNLLIFTENIYCFEPMFGTATYEWNQ